MWMMTRLGSQAAPQAAPVLVATVNTPANHVYGSVICVSEGNCFPCARS
jgi:hypothetical protein